MEYVERLGSLFNSVSSFYNDINPATLSGAVDIVVVEQEDGDLTCSPFHVRFGKLSLLMPQEKKVRLRECKCMKEKIKVLINMPSPSFFS